MRENNLKERFMRFALNIVQFTDKFPQRTVYFVISKQLLKAASSCAANYRASCRGKSKPDFIAKLGIVEEETDESLFWLEFTERVDEKWKEDVAPLKVEAEELLAITVASIKTAKYNLTQKSP